MGLIVRPGGRVIATAGSSSTARTVQAGAAEVLDYRDNDWPERVRELTGGLGVDAAVNTTRGGGPDAILAVRDGGRMATITGDPPEGIRGVSVSAVYVRPDAAQLDELCALLGNGRLSLSIGATFRWPRRRRRWSAPSRAIDLAGGTARVSQPHVGPVPGARNA